MSGHLPECWLVEQPAMILRPFCICDRLRACQARVLDSDVDAEALRQNMAFRKGLDAAREAVAALPDTGASRVSVALSDALAAIDALRGAE